MLQLPAVTWLGNQPYLLLSLTSLFWAGNVVLARYVAGHVPPITLSCIRWCGTFVLLLPFAWSHMKRDWPILRAHWPMILIFSATGFALNNVLSYSAMQYTEALNGLLMQSSGPLFVALWSLTLFGVRLTRGQFVGIVVSFAGVLIIILHGDVTALTSIRLNKGDLMYAACMFAFGLYSALMPRRPKVHQLSLIGTTTACGALMLMPASGWELTSGGGVFIWDRLTVAAIFYVVIFPSALAYLFFNRGVELIGPNRAAPFQHLMPVFGSVMAIAFLGERLQLFHLIGYALVLAGVVTASRK
ncbi:MAG TPA: DMT family transporter [Xanthobacteraceae bacterium]